MVEGINVPEDVLKKKNLQDIKSLRKQEEENLEEQELIKNNL
jgi:hypothetical protein